MKRERTIRIVAGTLVLTGTLLSYFVNTTWIWLSVFVGANLLQSGFTNWCPLEKILIAIGKQKQKPICGKLSSEINSANTIFCYSLFTGF